MLTQTTDAEIKKQARHVLSLAERAFEEANWRLAIHYAGRFVAEVALLSPITTPVPPKEA